MQIQQGKEVGTLANKKKGSQKAHHNAYLLATAILNLVAALISLIKSLTD